MAGRTVERSAAFAALSVGGQRVLKVIEAEVKRGGGAISLDDLMDRADLCRSSVRRGIRQCEALSFITVTMGPRRTNEFKLADGWRELSADEAARRVKQARLPTPPRQTSAPPRAARPLKVRVEVEQPAVERRAPSLPQVQWLGGSAGAVLARCPILRSWSPVVARRYHRAFFQRQRKIGKCRQIRSSPMSARLPWHCGTCTRNAEVELFQAVASAPRARRSLKRIAARCSARQAVGATSAAEPLMLMIGRQTTCWRTALAAHTQSTTIFQLILSATTTGGTTTLRSFNGY